MKTNKLLIFAAVLGLLAIISSCSSGGSGTVTLNITDAPIDAENVENVVISITGLAYHTTNPDEWVEATEFEGPKAFDLLSLTGGVTDMLGQFDLPAGEISQLRFYLDAPETGSSPPSNPGSYVKLAGSQELFPLFVPSGNASGFKATGAFDVPLNGVITLTADFDLRKSVRKTGSAYNLQPTIRIIADGQAGTIKGDVSYTGANVLAVFAYENGAYADTETAATDILSAFSNAVTSSAAADSDQDQTLDYCLAFLAAGTYDLVAAEFNSEGQYIDGSAVLIEDVIVESGKTTDRDISI